MNSPAERTIDLEVALDLERTLPPIVHGVGSAPTMMRVEHGLAWTFAPPAGDVTLEVTMPEKHRLHARAWGPGGAWALANLESLVGLEDDVESFDPEHPLLRRLRPKLVGARLPKVAHVTDVLIRIVLSQLVTNADARRMDHELARRFGRDAPGPHRLRMSPTGPTLGRLALEDLLDAGLLLKQAKTVQYLGRRATKVDELATMEKEARKARLAVLRGIGPWSAGYLELLALGDADAIPVGDYHIPNLVAYTLAGEPRADDARMLEVLEPFAGHRGRVVQWLHLSGLHAPRYGPKRAPRDSREAIARRRRKR